MAESEKLTLLSVEKRAVVGLASVYGVRMLGLFLILPVFSLYARDIPGSTPMLIGLAIGVYGLTQACLQIPMGLVSDRVGRKPVILFGLLMMLVGSLVAALANTIEVIIIGRALQGCGAIAAATLALVGDLTRESVRSRAMAVVGMSIGLSFMLAMSLAPWLDSIIGVKGIFFLTAALSAIGMMLVIFLVPASATMQSTTTIGSAFSKVLRNGQLLRLNFGIFSLHFLLTADFVVLPLLLVDRLGLPIEQHAWVYAGCLLGSVILMVPFLIAAERKQRNKTLFIGALIVIIATHIVLAGNFSSVPLIVTTLLIFLAAFNLLEANLPAFVTRVAGSENRGAATGVYSSCQFFGIFCGGTAGGWLYGEYGVSAVFIACAILTGLWLLVAFGMQLPAKLDTKVIPVPSEKLNNINQFTGKLAKLPGVKEVTMVENNAHLRVDRQVFDEDSLRLLV